MFSLEIPVSIADVISHFFAQCEELTDAVVVYMVSETVQLAEKECVHEEELRLESLRRDEEDEESAIEVLCV